ncbi:MAG: hypothetical protein WC788_01340 [Candidatus Paceibacterota bacterium]|jgi:hypothetical protein
MEFGVLYWDIYMIRSLYVYPQETESEQKFCQSLAGEVNAGKAVIEIKNGCLVLQLSDNAKYEMDLKAIHDNREKEEKIKTLIDAIEKFKKGRFSISAKTNYRESWSIVSVSINFEVDLESKGEIKPVPVRNKKEEGKRKRSIWRCPTKPKDAKKLANWERIYT